MVDRIKKLIEENFLDSAKEEIKRMENELNNENSASRVCALKRQISDLKSEYSAKIEKKQFDISENQYLIENQCKKEFLQEDKKATFDDLSDQDIKRVLSSEIKFNRCFGITTETVECNSLVIQECCNSKIKAVATQIRLINCSDMSLEICTKTGVYLEKCTNIKIKKLGGYDNNEYRKVFDFTDPTGRNYEIIDDFY